MSRYLRYIPFDKIQKIQIYMAKGKYTAAQVKSITGCDYIINGGLYTMATMKPNCPLKVDGVVQVIDKYSYIAPAWNNPPTNFSFDSVPANGTLAKQNYIAAMTFKYGGKKYDYAINSADKNPAIGYSTKRSAIGIKNGQLALYVGSDSFKPSALYNYLNSQGWSDIMMMDGGGSTQGDLGNGMKVTSTRKVHNYICVYLKDGPSTGTDPDEPVIPPPTDFVNGKNPYPVPTRAITYGMTGNDVRWVQYQLNCHDLMVDVDGSCGPACQSAIKEFQADHGLDVDGSCGPATREALKKDHPADLQNGGCISGSITARNPYSKPTRSPIKYYTTGEDVKWIQFQIKEAGYYKMEIDGSYGPGTVEGVKTFQRANGLEVDGSCGPATQAALMKL